MTLVTARGAVIVALAEASLDVGLNATCQLMTHMLPPHLSAS